MRGKLRERFLDKVDFYTDSGCWEWIGNCHRDGYGRIKVGRRLVSAHRVAWELARGPIPDDMHVLHRCDNPPCVNPNHLFLGTHSDNMADRSKKGRWTSPRQKLTAEDVEQIRVMLSNKVKGYVIAAMFGVSNGAISNIKNGKSWAS